MNTQVIKMSHGSGGAATHRLIDEIFLKYFGNDKLNLLDDGAYLNLESGKIVISTDSYVINPIFFPGGDIGKLSVCGTLNDIAVCGAKPKYLTSGMIIEEGFSLKDLESICQSMSAMAKESDVQIVTGDTKVVEKGACDNIFINTAGVGTLIIQNEMSPINISLGDAIIINGPIGNHGIAIMSARNKLGISSDVISDCSNLAPMLNSLIEQFGGKIKFMRDATRGGLGAVLNEIVTQARFGLVINEDEITIEPQVNGACEMLGLDPFLVANEGKSIIICEKNSSEQILNLMKKFNEGKQAKIIGRVSDEHKGMAVVKSSFGGNRIITMPEGEQLPRIC